MLFISFTTSTFCLFLFGWVGGQFLESEICIISLPALGALRTGALFAVINDEVMIMVVYCTL